MEKAAGEAVDFAGSTVVHINAGVAVHVLTQILGKRRGHGKYPSQRPHKIPFVMLGTAWCGTDGSASTGEAPAQLRKPG
ncbi:hypothetical protein GCM10025778_09230 [Paeniglutamicibacter antarcticus]|uniref:Ammonium transporter AmtB-like domain-containing protein n=1 Tax=Paeniglutamicibacter antarcticus TaxID=494023 RepID=A0ABP9TKZ3_9MICC